MTFNSKFLLAILFAISMTVANFAHADALAAGWNAISGAEKCESAVSGDVYSDSGAHITLSRITGKNASGGVISGIDVAKLPSKTLTFSSDIKASNRAGGAIWLRVQDINGKVLLFETSAKKPVQANISEHRVINVELPDSANKMVFGAVLNGLGSVEFLNTKITASAPEISSVSPGALFQAAQDIVKKHAYHADQIDWNWVNQAQIRANTAQSQWSVHSDIEQMLKMLNDHHSRFMKAAHAANFNNFGAPAQALVTEFSTDGMGYLQLPSFFGRGEDGAVSLEKAALSEFANNRTQAQCGWIIDLTENSGGNMWPMLKALRPLLGGGVLFELQTRDGERRPVQLYQLTANLVSPDLKNMPVAVLLGSHTASSGELVAVAFSGRPQTRSFGVPTAGLANSNSSFKLPDGSMIFLKTAIAVDRNGRVFGEKVAPDVNDEQNARTTASNWLKEQCK